MSLSIKVSQLRKLPSLQAEDYFPLNDSGSATTYQTDFFAVLDLIAASGSSLSSSYSVTSSYSKTSSFSDQSSTSSFSQTSSYSLISELAFTANSASYILPNNTASYSVTSSYAKVAESSLGSPFASTATSASEAAHSVNSDVADVSRAIYMKGSLVPDYAYVVKWSSSLNKELGGNQSSTTIVDRCNIVDLYPQFNIGKPIFFTTSETWDENYAEVHHDNGGFGVYKQWLTFSYLFSSGSNAVTGSFPGYLDPTQLPPPENLRYIPKDPSNPGETNYRDESGIGSQVFSLYFRAQRYFSWYLGGSFFGHKHDYLTPGISSSVAMVLTEGRLGIGDFRSGSSYFSIPQAPLHISHSYGTSTDPLLRLDQVPGSSGTIGSLAGWFMINISGSNYKVPLYQ